MLSISKERGGLLGIFVGEVAEPPIVYFTGLINKTRVCYSINTIHYVISLLPNSLSR